MQAEALALDEWLRARDVPTIWVAIHPMAFPSAYWFVQENRVAYNEWLLTSGEVSGTKVDCTAALEDPARPDALRPTFFTYLDLFNIDGIHMNADGYDALARCLEPEIRAVMTGGPAGPDEPPSVPDEPGDDAP